MVLKINQTETLKMALQDLVQVHHTKFNQIGHVVWVLFLTDRGILQS